MHHKNGIIETKTEHCVRIYFRKRGFIFISTNSGKETAFPEFISANINSRLLPKTENSTKT